MPLCGGGSDSDHRLFFLLGFSTIFCRVLPAKVNFKDFLLMYLLHFSIYRSCYKHLAQVQQGQMNTFMSQKSDNITILKDNPIFYLRPGFCSS